MLSNPLSIATIALALTSFVSAKPVGCGSFKNLIVFGDSYSDVNNVYTLSNHTWPLPSYYKGHFSNGPVWGEHVAKAKNLKLQDFAFGGATSDSNLVQGYSGSASSIPVPGFIQQIENLYAPTIKKKKDLSDTLFVVNFQGNDFFFDPSLDPKLVVGKLHDGIERLVSLGAENILLFENTNIGTIPYFNTNATLSSYYTSIGANERTEFKLLEKKLAGEYGRTDAKHPFRRQCKNAKKVNVGYIDIWALYETLYKPKQLEKLGITDVINGCVSNDYKTVCKDAGKHFYWDAFHPTAKIHKEIARAVIDLL